MFANFTLLGNHETPMQPNHETTMQLYNKLVYFSYICWISKCVMKTVKEGHLNSESAQHSAFWCGSGIGIIMAFPFLIPVLCLLLYNTKKLKVVQFHYLKHTFFAVFHEELTMYLYSMYIKVSHSMPHMQLT